MNRPGAGDGQGEHSADHGRLDHRAEGLIVVDAGSLGEATKDPMSLVLQNPFVGDDIGANG
jgi:hypothetical protein